jgi:hypothetical protein
MAITISGLAFHTKSFCGAICNVYTDIRASHHVRTPTKLSHIGVCVTNNNGFWIRWLDLLALLYNYSQLWQLTINDCLRLAPFLTGPRASLLLWRMENDESLPTHWTPLRMTSESELLYDWRFTANQSVLATSPLRLTTSNFIFQLNTCGYSLYVTSSLWREDGSVVYNCCWCSPAHSFSDPSPAGRMSTYYCLRLETSQLGGLDPHIYIPQERGGPVIPQGTWFPSHRLRLRITSKSKLYYDRRSVGQSVLE